MCLGRTYPRQDKKRNVEKISPIYPPLLESVWDNRAAILLLPHRRADPGGAVLSHQEGAGADGGRRLRHHTLQWRDALLRAGGGH